MHNPPQPIDRTLMPEPVDSTTTKWLKVSLPLSQRTFKKSAAHTQSAQKRSNKGSCLALSQKAR